MLKIIKVTVLTLVVSTLHHLAFASNKFKEKEIEEFQNDYGSSSSSSSQTSFLETESQKLNDDHTSIRKIVEKHLQENPNLLNSSRDKDIVIFLGKTGAGKSTLINYLSNEKLEVYNNGMSIRLRNLNNPQTMRIGSNAVSETSLPKFIGINNLLFYDLPGFGDTRGTAMSLINACFIKTLIQNAKTTRLVFVTAQDELIAERSKLFKELIGITKKFIPDQAIEECSLLVITKASSSDNQILIDFLRPSTQTDPNDVNSSPLTPWINKQAITRMSSPLVNNKTINQNDRADILTAILNILPKKFNNVNIAAIYNGEEQNQLREIYRAEIIEISKKIYSDNFNSQEITTFDIEKLQDKKSYFENDFIINITKELDRSSLINLLKPLSTTIYNEAWNEQKKTLQSEVDQSIKSIDTQLEKKVTQHLPAGVVASFAGTAAPQGWLLCHGQSISCKEYHKLYKVIGRAYIPTTCNPPVGDDLFCVPDLRGRTAVGTDSSLSPANRITTNNTLSASGGEEKHLLTISEMPSHAHKNMSGTTDRNSYNSREQNYEWHAMLHHAFNYQPNILALTKEEGNNQSHNNMQPYLVLNYIIKY